MIIPIMMKEVVILIELIIVPCCTSNLFLTFILLPVVMMIHANVGAIAVMVTLRGSACIVMPEGQLQESGLCRRLQR